MRPDIAVYGREKGNRLQAEKAAAVLNFPTLMKKWS